MTDLEKAFRLLQVSPGDDAKTIRKAWRALVRTYHPDTARIDPVGANKRLTEINVAFDAVSACNSDEVEKLKAMIAKREQLKERARRETLARQNKARSECQSKKDDGKAKPGASETSKKEEAPQKEHRASRQAEPVVSAPVVQAPSLRRKASKNVNGNSLVARAEQGFADAMQVCSRLAFLPKRSSYV